MRDVQPPFDLDPMNVTEFKSAPRRIERMHQRVNDKAGTSFE